MGKDFFRSLRPFQFHISGERLLLPLGTTLGLTSLLLLTRGIVLRTLDRDKHKRSQDLTWYTVIRVPSIYWCFALGLYAGIGVSDIEGKYARELFEAVHVIIILSLTQAAANVSGAVFRQLMQATDQSGPTSGLAIGVVKGVVTSVGLLLVLSVMGISVTPILTALGVGGLAVALALKDTLENLFAGLYLISDRTIRVGNVIRLETGQEGIVEDIGWRTVRIRTFNNNFVILPNSKLAQSIVINFSLPDKHTSVTLPILVGFGADIDKVEHILTDTAKKGMEDIAGLLGNPEPTARFNPGVGEDSLGFQLGFHVRQYQDQWFVLHELRKRIYKRFCEEKIPLPRKWVGWVQQPGD